MLDMDVRSESRAYLAKLFLQLSRSNFKMMLLPVSSTKRTNTPQDGGISKRNGIRLAMVRRLSASSV